MKKGYFITFEGPDGSGKTTISTRVFEKLNALGHTTIYTREPGGILISEKIRDIILNPEHINMDPKTEALLYAAARRQHLVEKIIPNLEKGHIVISDRFVDSSLAYQGIGRGIGLDEVYDLNMFAIEGYLPDLTIFLDIDPETGLQRLENRPFKDRLDQEGLAFHQAVTQGYEIVKKKYDDRITLFDATQSIETLVDNITNYILTWIKQHER